MQKNEDDGAFLLFLFLGIGLYVAMLLPSSSSNPKQYSSLNLFQIHSDASIEYLLEQSLNRAILESHRANSPPFYAPMVQHICGTMSHLVGTLNTATLYRSLSVSLTQYQRAPMQKTNQEIKKFGEAISRELDKHSFEIDLKPFAKVKSFLGNTVPCFVLLLFATILFGIIAEASNAKIGLLFVLYIPPIISILSSRGFIDGSRFNPFSISFEETQSHVGYSAAMQALVQTIPHVESKINISLHEASMFQIEDIVLKHNQTLRQQFNSSVGRKHVYGLLDLASLIHTLRYYLINEYIIGMIGTSNTGKSTLCHKMWNLDTSPSIANRTVNVQMYYLPEQPLLRVMDFPGSNDLDDGVAKQWKVYKQLVKLWIIIVDGQHIEREQVQLIGQIKSTNISYIVLINQMDKFVREFKNDDVAWLRFRKEKCEDLLTPEESCFLTAIDPLVPLNNSVVLNASATAKAIGTTLQQLGFLLESAGGKQTPINLAVE